MPPFYSDVASNALRRAQVAKKTAPVRGAPITSHMADPTQTLLPTDTPVDTGGAQTPPAAPPTSGGSPIPGIDPFLQASATTAYMNALNQVNQGRTSKLGTYGFKADSFDDQGNPVGLGVDPNSLYGNFQQLLQGQAGDAAGAEANAAGRGLAGSGLANAAEGGMKYGWGAQDVDLGRGLTSDLGSLSAQALSAKDAYNNTIYSGTQDAIWNALNAGDFTSVDDPGYTPPTTWDDNSSMPPDDTQTKRPSVKGNTVLWNNQYMNAQKLARTLTASGTSVRTFIQQHPAAAKALKLKAPAVPKKKNSTNTGGR